MMTSFTGYGVEVVRRIFGGEAVPLAGAYSNPRVQEEVARLHDLISHLGKIGSGGDLYPPSL
jgi:hypothetical protein